MPLSHSTVAASSSLKERLVPPERIIVRQDDREVSSGHLREQVELFADEFKRLSPSRVALHAVRADITLAVLIAALETGCELLLVRELYPSGDAFWKNNEVKVVYDQDFQRLHLTGSNYCPEKAGVLLTTSGTTGEPKVVLHEVEKLLGRVRSGQTGDRWLLTYHPASFAGMQVLLTAFCSRSLIVAFSGLSAAELVLKAVGSDVTHLSGTPTFWRSLLLAFPQHGKGSQFKQITLGGEAVDQSTLDALHRAFPEARIIHIYASTEAGSLFAVKDLQAGFPAQWLEEGVDGCRVRIQVGVLEVQSPRAMKNYCGPAADRTLTDDGWISTGDLVEVVGGRVLFRGRLDSILNVGGGKVMPEQVEALLLELPFVREARVYGIKNPLAGEVLAADVVLATTITESAARQQIFSAISSRLEPYKVPRLFRFVEQIPTNAAGKKIRTDL